MIKLRHQQATVWEGLFAEEVAELRLTRQILNDSRRVWQEIETLPARRRRSVIGLGERLEAMADQVRRVVRQTKFRVFAGLTQFPDKLVSLFEPHTEIIRKGKAGKPNEFGKLVELQEAENQIITHYEVYDERPSDRHLLLPAVEAHRRKLGRVPGWVAADAGSIRGPMKKVPRSWV